VQLIYKQGYWDKVKGDNLPSGLDFAIFDWAVNSGPGRAAKALQKAVGATADGAIGPKTLEAVEAADAAKTIKAVADEREAFYKSLRTFNTFGKGWLRRNKETRDFALEMV
jgi:lysozyme family protein